jgi:hypothetical protein
VAYHTGNSNQDIVTMLLLLSPSPLLDLNQRKSLSSRKSDCPDDTSDKAKEDPSPRGSADDNCHQRDDHSLKLKKKDIVEFLS